jgi:2,4-dienoyl-CoA reductase-like NADH-dependent reductase (Old Yellow Enzyme family)
MASSNALFRPFRIHNLTLANRIVMAPMTRNFSPGGVPGPDVAAYYRRRAENGVGLILTEGTAIAHPAAVSSPRVPRFHGADALAGWAAVLAGVHAAGGRIMPQLWHVGMMRKPGDEPNPEAPPVGPSGIAVPAGKLSEPLTETEIDGLIAAYAQGAADSKRLGFDGVELHGAHGYLIDQFFWEVTNQRTDRYGGDATARTRFAAAAVRACRRAVGPDFPILLRFSQWKIADYNARLASTPDVLERFLAPLADAGVDIFHCSTRRFWEPEFPGSDLNLAGWTKKLTGRPAITVGSVGLDNDFMTSFREGKTAGTTALDRIVDMIARDEVDLVAVGRALLADPAWAVKVRDGRTAELQPFSPDAMKVLT